MIEELISYRHFIKNLVFKDLKLKYRDSLLGFVWSLLNPLMMLMVYTLAFKVVLRVQMDNYVFFLMTGLLPWIFFSGAALAATHAITGNGNLLRKVYFPRETLPIATVLFAFAQFLLALAVFLPALVLASGTTLRWTAVLFLPLVLFHLMFTIGVAFVLSALTTSFRDVAHLTEVALLLLLWVTPIMYPATMAPAELQLFFRTSPLAAFSMAYQDVLFWGRLPEPLVVATIVGWTLVTLLVGLAVFRWYDPVFAEEV